MYRKFPKLTVTALVVGLLIAGGHVWADTIETTTADIPPTPYGIPLSGNCTMKTVDPGFQWTDKQGILHIRDMVRIGTECGCDTRGNPISGTSEHIISMDINRRTGDGTYESVAVCRDVCYGCLTGPFHRTGAFRGVSTATITGFVISGEYTYQRGGGDFCGWKHLGTFTTVMGSETMKWKGLLCSPVGSGGAKAAAQESATWSSVKALYR